MLNALKIALGCAISMFLAALTGLKYSATTGLITVLSIQPTKKETIYTAIKRLAAYFIAMFVSVLSFKIFGYTILAFGIYLFIFVIACNMFAAQSAIVPISVLVTHLLAERDCSVSLLVNEFLIFVIGAGIGIILNMHLHRNEKKEKYYRAKLDNEIRAIIGRMSDRILTDDKSDYNGECFERINRLLYEAEKVVYENESNVLSNAHSYGFSYLEMRRKQSEVLYEMYKSVRRIDTTPVQAEKISDFLKKISNEYDEHNNVMSLVAEIDRIFGQMQDEKMPENRAEFESRAILFNLLHQTREFLMIKYEFAELTKLRQSGSY